MNFLRSVIVYLLYYAFFSLLVGFLLLLLSILVTHLNGDEPVFGWVLFLVINNLVATPMAFWVTLNNGHE